MIANVSPSISTRKNLDSATKSNCLDACESFYCEHRCVKIDFDIQVVWWAPILISYYVDRGHPIPNLVHTPAAKKNVEIHVLLFHHCFCFLGKSLNPVFCVDIDLKK